MDAKLDAFGQATVAGNTASIRIGPRGESWNVTLVTVKATTKVLESVCTVYLNSVGDPFIRDITYTGSTGDTSDTQYDLRDGDALYFVWTNADNGAVVTVTLRGTRTMPVGGFRAV